MDGTLTVQETDSIINTVINNYEIITSNDLSINGTMAVSGNTSLNGDVTINGLLNAKYPNDSIPSSALIDFDTKADKPTLMLLSI